jgi:hypothetical protein
MIAGNGSQCAAPRVASPTPILGTSLGAVAYQFVRGEQPQGAPVTTEEAA